MSTKIFVGSLPSGTKPEELRHLFESHGVVTECDVMNRCGFVHMEKPEMAAKAIKALNSTKFKGETLNVEPGRIRDRNQKPGGIGAARSGNNRQRGGRNQRMQNFNDAGMMGPIDERTTKDALQLCSAVLEEINKLVNTDQIGATRRGGFPQNFVENQIGAVLGGMNGPKGPNNRGPRNRNNGPPKQASLPAPAPLQAPVNRGAVKNNANQAQRGPAPNQGNMNRGAKQAPNQSGPQGRGPNQDNAGRMQNQGNQGFSGRNQNAGNVGRVPKQGNVGPIRNEPSRQQQRATAAPYNRGPVNNDVNFADDVPIVNSARNFANSLASGSSQIDRWQSNNGNFGNEDMNRHPMNRNFDEDIPMNNFNDAPIVINMVTRPSGSSGMGGNDRRGAMNNQSLSNQGNFGHGGPVDDPFQASNDRFQGGNDRFMGRNNDRFQGNNNNDRFQGGNSSGNFGNQDRRGFALPEKQMFNDSPSFGNSDLRSGGMSQFGGQNNQGNMGGGNRNVGFGNNTNNNAGRQQSAPESRNMGMGGGGMNSNSGNAMFTRRNNNNMGNMDGNNMGNNRMRNDVQDSNRGGNFGGNNNRSMGNTGGGGMNSNNAGFNRNNNMGGNTANLHGPISANNRNMGGGNANMNRNSGNGMGNNNNRNMQGGGGMGNNVNRNMGGNNSGNNMNRNNNNMGGNSKQINPLNFQKDFPALQSGGQNMNMNNRNGPRQNMMSNRRY